MQSNRVDEIKAILKDMDTEEGWADWCNRLGDWDALNEREALWTELIDLFEAGYYGTEEARYITGEA